MQVALTRKYSSRDLFKVLESREVHSYRRQLGTALKPLLGTDGNAFGYGDKAMDMW